MAALLHWHRAAPRGAQVGCVRRDRGPSRPGRDCPRSRAARAADAAMKPDAHRPAVRREPAFAIALFLVAPLILALGAAAHVR